MSDENRKDEPEVEAHHRRAGAKDEPAEEADTEVEAHLGRVASVRMDSPSSS